MAFAWVGWLAGRGKIRTRCGAHGWRRRWHGKTLARSSAAGEADEARSRVLRAGRRYAARSDMAFAEVAALLRQLEHPMLLPT